jgi:hypothetical protein
MYQIPSAFRTRISNVMLTGTRSIQNSVRIVLKLSTDLDLRITGNRTLSAILSGSLSRDMYGHIVLIAKKYECMLINNLLVFASSYFLIKS